MYIILGVGFDINCGVRLLRTNLFEKDVRPLQEQLAQSLFDHIPVGKYSKFRKKKCLNLNNFSSFMFKVLALKE